MAPNTNFPIEILIYTKIFHSQDVVKSERKVSGSVDESGPPPRGMHAAVVLVNSEHPVAQAILARGMMEGLAFQTSTPTIEALKQKHAAVLAAFPSALQTYEKDGTRKTYLQIEGEIDELEIPDDAHRMLIGTGPTDGALEPNTCYVRLHDMLPPLPNSHDERMFYAWMEASGAKKTPTMEQRQRHWCDLNDAVPAIIEMLKGGTEATVYNLAGRRAWTMESTWQEFDALFQRTRAGRTGEFEFEHLEAKGIPAIAVVEVDADEQAHRRPPLTSTHAYLESKTGEGWRPTTPLRRSLMVVIANLEEPQTS